MPSLSVVKKKNGGSILCRCPLLLCVHGCSTNAISTWQLFMASLSISWFLISIVFSVMFPGPCRVFYFHVCFTSYKMGMKFAFTTFQRCRENSRIRKDLKKNSYWNNHGIFTTFMLWFSHMIQWKLMFKLPEQLLNLKILFKLIWGLVNLSLQINMELCMEQMWCASSTGLQLVFAE